MRLPSLLSVIVAAVVGFGCRTNAPETITFSYYETSALVRTTNKTNAFEKEILAFEASDKTNPPPKHAILFIGSSSIRMWKTLARDFPDYQVINRGFGGSQIADSVYFFDRIVAKYEPRTIVFYAGGNDINAGKSAEIVFDDFKHFVSAVHEKLPGTKIVYIAIAPNPARWSQIERVREANKLIRDFSASERGLSFIDVHPDMLGPDAQPKPDIYRDDKLHMNDKGYAIWTRLVNEHLKSIGEKADKKE